MNAASNAPRVLIVEQDISLQAAIALPLFEAGYETATTRHREEALAAMIENPYDVVVLDPFEGRGMLELLGSLRTDELLGFPRIILVTAHAAQAREALNNGWADMAFDKEGLDWQVVAQAVGDLLADV